MQLHSVDPKHNKAKKFMTIAAKFVTGAPNWPMTVLQRQEAACSYAECSFLVTLAPIKLQNVHQKL